MKMRSKSILLVICILLTLSPVINANVVGISIISESHHVSGYAGNEQYSYTDVIPVSGFASGVGWDGYGCESSSVAGNFNLDASYWASAGDGKAIATSTYIFSPNTQFLSMVISGYVDESHGLSYRYENDVHFRFTDITQGGEIVYYTADNYYDGESVASGAYDLNWEQDYYLLNPVHQYELSLYIREGPAGEGSIGHSWLNVSIVPEPCSLVLLSLGGLILRRTRKA
jgi:hypothetical protein